MKIGWGEALVILVLALIVLGPDKLPELGKSLGKAVRSVKKYVNEAAGEIVDAEELKDIKKDVESIRGDVTSIGRDLEKNLSADLDNVAGDVEKAVTETAAEIEKMPEAPERPETPAADMPTENETKTTSNE